MMKLRYWLYGLGMLLALGLVVGQTSGINGRNLIDGTVTLPKTGGIATGTIAGRQTAGSGSLEALTPANARTVLGLGGLATLSAVGSSEITNGSIATADIGDGQVTLAKTGGVAQGCVAGRTTAGSGALECLTAGTNITISGGTISASGGGGSSNFTGSNYPFGSAVRAVVGPNPAQPASDLNSRITVCPNDLTPGELRLPASPATGDTVVIYRPFCDVPTGIYEVYNSAGSVVVATSTTNNTVIYARWSGSAWATVSSNGTTEVNFSELAGLASTITRVFCLNCASVDGLGTVVVRVGNKWVDEDYRINAQTSVVDYFLAWARAAKPIEQSTTNPYWFACDQRLWASTSVYNCFVPGVTGAGAGTAFPDAPANTTLIGGSGLTTGTTATGRAGWFSQTAASQYMRVPRLAYMRVDGVRLNALCNGTETCQLRIGFSSQAPGAADANTVQVLAYWDHTLSGWRLQNANGGAVDTNTSAAGPVATTNSQTIELLLDNTSSPVISRLYINGGQVATSSTNVPAISNTTRIGPYIEIRKTLGTTARIMYANRVYIAVAQLSQP